MAPRAYLFCDDVNIAGAAMFVMERRVGEVIRGIVPPSMRHHDRLGDRIGRALASAIAEFHSLNPTDVELETLGRPNGFVSGKLKDGKKMGSSF